MTEKQRKLEAIDKMICPLGPAEPEPFDLGSYDCAPLKTKLPPSAWRSIGPAFRSQDAAEELRKRVREEKEAHPLMVVATDQSGVDELRIDAIRELTRQLDEASAEIACLTEERDNARANAEHFAALLNQRDAPKPAHACTPEGALAPIPRNSPLGETLAALRSAKRT